MQPRGAAGGYPPPLIVAAQCDVLESRKVGWVDGDAGGCEEAARAVGGEVVSLGRVQCHGVDSRQPAERAQ